MAPPVSLTLIAQNPGIESFYNMEYQIPLFPTQQNHCDVKFTLKY